MFKIRKSTYDDIDNIMSLFDMARVTMAKLGIDQWQDGYPYRTNIEEDVRSGESYVVTDEDGNVAATFMLMKRNEPTYEKIYGGQWLTSNDMSYATIHRITVAPASRATAENAPEKPISAMIVAYAVQFAKDNGLTGGVKVDTHKGNIAMRKMLEKNGFEYCGIIYLADGQERVAYQKC